MEKEKRVPIYLQNYQPQRPLVPVTVSKPVLPQQQQNIVSSAASVIPTQSGKPEATTAEVIHISEPATVTSSITSPKEGGSQEPIAEVQPPPNPPEQNQRANKRKQQLPSSTSPTSAPPDGKKMFVLSNENLASLPGQETKLTGGMIRVLAPVGPQHANETNDPTSTSPTTSKTRKEAEIAKRKKGFVVSTDFTALQIWCSNALGQPPLPPLPSSQGPAGKHPIPHTVRTQYHLTSQAPIQIAGVESIFAPLINTRSYRSPVPSAKNCLHRVFKIDSLSIHLLTRRRQYPTGRYIVHG
jgi:hypothetical protein